MSEITMIGLVGHAGVGKDTVANVLRTRWGFHHESFASPLRGMVRAMLRAHGLPEEAMRSRLLKELPLPIVGVSPRRLMQQLGEGWRRCDEQVWVNLAAMRLGLHGAADSVPRARRIVISDVRYRNEAAWVREMGGKLLRIIRNDAPPVHAHESERQLGYIACDHTLANDGTLTRLDEDVAAALRAMHVDLHGAADDLADFAQRIPVASRALQAAARQWADTLPKDGAR